MVAVLGFSKEQIHAAVREMYTLVADRPAGPLHFPVGAKACKLAGYSEDQIGDLPVESLESFAGVGCPFRAEVIRTGDVVLDVGSGSGTDVVLASKMVGDTGKVWALDMTPAMRQKLEQTLKQHNITNVEILKGDAEHLPLPDQSVDVISSNGVLNLVPDKRRAIAEIFRVLKPGGYVQIADIVIASPVTPDCEDDPRLWAECVVGATVDESYLNMFRDAGFEEVEVLRDYDYFAHSPSADTREVAKQFGARAVELRMRREGEAPSKVVQWARRMTPRRIAGNLQRRGLWGVLSFLLAVAACYGTLALVGLLSALGISLAINDHVWAGAIVGFAWLAAGIVALGMRKHRSPVPAIIAGMGALALVYAMYVGYSLAVEIAGFALLAAGTYLDFDLRRWSQVSGGRKAAAKRRRAELADTTRLTRPFKPVTSMQLTLPPDRTASFPRLPFGLLAYLATGASLLVCYGKSILLASFAGSLEVPYFNPHVQAVLMWVLGTLAVCGLFQDRRAHGSTAPLAVGAAGVVVIVATLYSYYDITIEISGYILLLTAAFLNQNVFLRQLNERVKHQALEVQTLNLGLEQRVEKQVDEIEKLNRLKRFLAPEVAELIVEGNRANLLKSHRAYIATLFCDLRGFTAFSSSMEPEEVMAVLQAYHETFGRLVAEHGGTIDHRAGDGLMVFFNDPLPVEQPVLQAVRLALHMRQRFIKLNRDWIRQGYSLGLGIGIASGYATLGIIGHEGRYDYTANGNAVNLAARLCDAAVDGQLLISNKALVDVNEQLEVEAVGPLALKGFSNQTTAHSILGERTGSATSVAQSKNMGRTAGGCSVDN